MVRAAVPLRILSRGHDVLARVHKSCYVVALSTTSCASPSLRERRKLATVHGAVEMVCHRPQTSAVQGARRLISATTARPGRTVRKESRVEQPVVERGRVHAVARRGLRDGQRCRQRGCIHRIEAEAQEAQIFEDGIDGPARPVRGLVARGPAVRHAARENHPREIGRRTAEHAVIADDRRRP